MAPSALLAGLQPWLFSDPGTTLAAAPTSSPKPETGMLLQGHSAWPGRSSDLNPGPLAPGLPPSGQQAGPVPRVSHAPGLWPPCQALWPELGEGGLCEKEGLPW